MLRHHDNMWCLTSEIHELKPKTSANIDNIYISGAKLTKPQLLRHANTSLFHRAETEECVKIPFENSLINKVKEISTRKLMLMVASRITLREGTRESKKELGTQFKN